MKLPHAISPCKKSFPSVAQARYFSEHSATSTKFHASGKKPIISQSHKPAPLKTLQLISDNTKLTQTSFKKVLPSKSTNIAKGNTKGIPQLNKTFLHNPVKRISNDKAIHKSNRVKNFTCTNPTKVFHGKHRHVTSMEASSFEKKHESDASSNDRLNMTMVEESKKKTNPKKLVAASKKSNELRMTEKEKTIYGNRFPRDYEKLSLLGKGGCAVVWLALKNSVKVAVKQFAKNNGLKSKADIDSCRVEVSIGKLLFSEGAARDDIVMYPGAESVVGYLDIIEDVKDVWVVYELGGPSLTKQLFEVKGDFYKGERLYKVNHLHLYEVVKSDKKMLKKLLKKLLEVLELLEHHNIVHCDLKPDNLLVSHDDKRLEVKVIDFGSAFIHGQEGVLRMTTPEYMPPECLELMRTAKDGLGDLAQKTRPWSVDMWSAGAVLLEIATGFPQWLSLKGVSKATHKTFTGIGAFAVSGKDLGKMLQKQRATVKALDEVLRQYGSFLKDESVIDLLKRMLDLNPLTRISPKEALKHPALA
eukprot:TRINITY_DN5379_c0_g1_i12.p1 TRINITY_DN5379_c0_g1~~TRINITY_DN5379_c0_g1_i12.p1  ORF type:complete len:530 (-),score=129.83 TRINITY_DN5379_c0_g1_i12:621-2210(-)